MDDRLIARLLAHWSFIDPETEIGRHVIFVRPPGTAGKASTEHTINPACSINFSQHVRTAIPSFSISWQVGATSLDRAISSAKRTW